MIVMSMRMMMTVAIMVTTHQITQLLSLEDSSLISKKIKPGNLD